MPQPLRWSLVIERFELPATFRGELRYEDDERDLISVSCDAEVEDALQLYGNSRTLKMFISARDSPVAASVCASAARKPAKKHTLYLGRNISDGSKVDDQMWRTFQRDTVNRLTTCSTTLDAEGCWYREIEETKIISVTVDEGSLNAQDILNNIKAVGEEWKRQFHQEAVTLTTTPVSNFVLI